MKIKDSIKLSKQGQELLEKKKYILIHEKEKYELEAKKLEKEFKELQEKTEKSLTTANIDIGIENVKNISKGIKIDNTIDVKYITIMGVEIPSIVHEKQEEKINYGFIETSIAVDEMMINFTKLKNMLIELAQIRTTIERLNESILKVQKRSNALKDIIIPENEQIEKEIQEILDEREREEFTRLKVMKKSLLLKS